MRKSFGVLAAGFCALSIAGPASAVLLDFSGSLTIENENVLFCTLGYINCPPVPVPVTLPILGAGTALVNGAGVAGYFTNLGLGGGEFAIEHYIVPVETTFGPVAGVQITATNGAGTFAGAGGDAFGGVMPLHGAIKVCLFGPCSSAVVNLDIPLSVVGQGGTAFFNGPFNLTVVGAPWTSGTAAIGTSTRMGGVSPLSDTGAPGGNLNLVTPIFISTNQSQRPVWGPVFGILRLDFFARECSDGLDNDGDGLFDYPSDPACKSADSGNERQQCQDGLDNDNDGKFDFDGGASANHGVALGPLDPQCTQPWQITEKPAACGLGAELALMLPLISLAASRRRRAKRSTCFPA